MPLEIPTAMPPETSDFGTILERIATVLAQVTVDS
jgi:hypothetical protein